MKPRDHAADHYRRMLSAERHPLERLDGSAAIVKCARNQEIPTGEARGGHWYCLITGAVRRSAIRHGGRRQIVELMLPRDFFLVSETQGEETVEAIAEHTVLASYPCARVELLAEQDRQLAQELREIASQSLARTRDQLMILGGITAVEKVGSFLLSLDERTSSESGRLDLALTRYDIAEYLAVSVETVCRAITDLQQRGIIALVGTRTIKILDRGALEHRARKKMNANRKRLIAA
ncbi:helix-turn-helix domain-containing protein [Bradyrhizobium pachyrhizi]|uniref:Helix-turn-helix domain-containing protein n=1 Tax=Bradyrhizobium pachyrhizi TaxID=280333 RepID=A0A844SLQ8_9BRAD|nr:helix-turn-helix domain-containing protein [Bradyrhizobium pachyrhizi]MVT64864.1 helix-turn-helix domain-containing protein [Bradyrhizobium pachyrhizi]